MNSLASKVREANLSIISEGKLDAIEEYYSSDYVCHLTKYDRRGGPGAVRGYVRTLRKAFPDLEVEVEVLVEGENRISWQRTLRGTHEAAFYGFPATGVRLVWRDMLATRFHEGLIAEEWAISDLVERLVLAIET